MDIQQVLVQAAKAKLNETVQALESEGFSKTQIAQVIEIACQLPHS